NQRQQHEGPDKPALVVVGTTSARTVESLYWIGVQLIRKEPVHFQEIAVAQWYPYGSETPIEPEQALEALLEYMDQNGMKKLVTRTQIIIVPAYRFRIVEGLITNFHQPRS